MANCFLAGMMVFLLIAADVALNTFSPVISSEVLAEAIKPELQTNDIVVVDGEYRHASALGFYLERHIEVMNPNSEEDEAALSGATVNLESLPSLQSQWDGSSRVFLWTTPQSAPNLPGSTYLIARDGGREILSNQPNSGGASF